MKKIRRYLKIARIVTVLCVLAVSFVTPTQALANKDALRMVNELRADHGRAPLKYSRKLERAARNHAYDMATMRRMTHKGSDGSNHGQRARAVGYKYCYSSENVAQGPWDLNGVIRAWAASPGHAKNMLNTKAREMAVYQAPGGYWVMMLAKPGCR